MAHDLSIGHFLLRIGTSYFVVNFRDATSDSSAYRPPDKQLKKSDNKSDHAIEV